MIPVLFELGEFRLYTFGIFLALAFFWGTFLVWRMISLTAYKEDDIFDSIFVGLGVGIVLSRIVYVAAHFGDFGLDILKIILVNGYPGMSLYGMIFGASMGTMLYLMRKRMRAVEVSDYIVPGALLALAIAKVGAFFAGTEVGTRTNIPIAVRYIGHEGLRHLTPLYEGVILALFVFCSYRVTLAVRRGEYKKGSAAVLCVWAFAAVMTCFEPIKQQEHILFGLSLNLLLSATILLTFSILVIYYFKGLFHKNSKRLQLSFLFKKKHG